jgi:hypothetical protein
MTWTDDHGEDGLRRKFDVYKPRDGRVSMTHPLCRIYAADHRIGADGEFIFVLRPETDEEAWWALQHYANWLGIAERDPQLAADIRRELRRIWVANDERTP